jgi:mannose-6-phosphate isomerase-like protein (cupin superfamily)
VVDKPWGLEEWLAVGERVAMKRIIVRAGRRLSLQLHREKEEIWLLLRGRARVRFGDAEGEIGAGDVLHLPPNTVHRIEALAEVEFIEASTAELADVVRIEDDYGRRDAG